MNIELARKWVEALRSGKYKQGRHSLRPKHDEFCCLGVLCDITFPNEWQQERSGEWIHFSTRVLPDPRVDEVLGLDSNITVAEKLLSDHNDERASFDEIADMIEQYIQEHETKANSHPNE